MEIVWYGSGCFRMTERGYPAVITDPYAENNHSISLPQLASEIVTSSRMIEEPSSKEWIGIDGVVHTIAGPGEYEIGGVFITGVTSHKNRGSKNTTPDNVIYTINIGGVIACQFGECGLVPTQSQLEILGRINILFIPVGISDGLSPAMASEIVSMIEPDIVIPTHFGLPDQIAEFKPVTPFLKLMGVDNPKVLTSIKVDSTVSPGATQVVLLDPVK